MITKPRRSEFAILLYAGLFLVGISALVWVYFFALRSWNATNGSAYRLSVSQAIDCLTFWSSDLCRSHFIQALGYVPADLAKLQWLLAAMLVAGNLAIAIGGYIAFLMPPDKVEGIFACSPGSSTSSSISVTAEVIWARSRTPRSWRGKAIFSPTVRESKSAPS